MAKRANQKLKLLYLAKILEEESDERHPMTVAQLIAALGRHGIAAERKSIYDDMAALEQFGLDVVLVHGQRNAYYLGERHFQLPEIKLLVDAVQSAKFITLGKSRELIKKICALASRHEGGALQRQIHVQGRTKTFNERTYYNVDAIQQAMAKGRQIAFKYFEWVVDPGSRRMIGRRWRHGGQPYQVSPWTLLWDDEYYYLVAFDGGAEMVKHYRVDKMTDIVLCETPREGQAVFERLDMGRYSTGVFGMFGGEEVDVRLRFDNRLIGVVVDRFGQDILIAPDGAGHFVTTVRAVVSPQFFAWVLGFGDEAEVLGPAEVRGQLRAEVARIWALYREEKA